MLDWGSLLKKYLPDVEDTIIAELEGSLRRTAGNAAANEIAPAYGRLLAKGIDAVAKATALLVQRDKLTPDEAKGVMVAWVRAARDAATELGNAQEVYAPLSVAVEIAKHPPHDMLKSDADAALAAARMARRAALVNFSTHTREYLLAIFGAD